jgi:hypothetical protein
MGVNKTVLFVIAATILAASAAFAADVPATLEYITLTESGSAAVPVIGGTESPVWMPSFSHQIDQNQPSSTSYIAAFSQGDLAQSFIQTNNNICGAGIFLQPSVGSSGPVTIALWTGLPNAGGTMVTSATATGTAGQWVDVFWNDVAITPITYYLVFTDGAMGIAGSISNPYPSGMCYANTGFGPWPGFDYAFRTYYETTYSLESTTWAGVKTLFN